MLVRNLTFLAALLLAGLSAGQDSAGKRGAVAHHESQIPGGTTYALLIGISQYESVRSLEFADKDAQLFYNFLTSPLGGVQPANILMLSNEHATRGAIDDAVRNFVEPNANPENSLIFFVAGHGVYLKSEVVNGKTIERSPYILTYDSRTDDAKTTGYPMDEFRAMIAGQALKFGRVMAYVDVCHAANIAGIGGGSELQASVGDIFRGAGGDLGLMVASSANKYAFESASFGGGHGAFSYFLVAGLNGSAASPNADSLRWDDLAQYVRDEVWRYTYKKQKPLDLASDDAFILIADVHRKGIELPAAQPLSKEDEQRESRNRQAFVAPTVAARSVQTPGEPDDLANAIARDALLPEDFANAYSITMQIQAGTPERRVAERRLHVALENAGQQIVNRYLEGDQVPQMRGDFERCSRLFEVALALEPGVAFDNSRALFCRGRALIFDRNYPDAERLLRQSIRIDPRHGYAWNALGISKLEQIDLRLDANAAKALFDTAEDAFRTAMHFAPYWAYPVHNLALTLSERGDFDGAIATYRAAMDIAPQYSYLPYNLGLLYARLGDLDEAQRWFESAVKVAEAYPRKQDGRWTERAEALNALGTVAMRRRRVAAAREYFERALADDGKDPNVRQNLALMAARVLDYTRADKLWSALLEDSPDYAAAHVAFAESLEKRGDVNGAVRQYKEILAKEPEWAGAHEALARLYLSSGDVGQALREANTALRSAPSNPFLLELRGDIDARLNLKGEAVTDWRRALVLAPDKNAEKRIRQKLKHANS